MERNLSYYSQVVNIIMKRMPEKPQLVGLEVTTLLTTSTHHQAFWVYHSWPFQKRCYPYMHTHQHCDIHCAGFSIFLKKIDCVVLVGVLFCFNPVTLLKDSVRAWHAGVPALPERHSIHWQTL